MNLVFVCYAAINVFPQRGFGMGGGSKKLDTSSENSNIDHKNL